MKAQGKVHIYTGNGKGKTTAAIGLAVRAAGAGWPVFVGHFIKAEASSEHAALSQMAASITVAFFGRGRLRGKAPDRRDMEIAEAGIASCRDAMACGKYRLVVLDEILVAVSRGVVSEEAVLSMIAGRPPSVEMVLTGRGATERLLAAADVVTEMRAVKHYFREGFRARAGIEK